MVGVGVGKISRATSVAGVSVCSGVGWGVTTWMRAAPCLESYCVHTIYSAEKFLLHPIYICLATAWAGSDESCSGVGLGVTTWRDRRKSKARAQCAG